MTKGHDGGLYRAAQLLVEALQSGANSPLEKIRLSQSLQALKDAEIESLETLYQLEGPQDVEVVSDRNCKPEENHDPN